MNDHDLGQLVRDLLDLEKRDKAAFAIAEIGPAAGAAVPNLVTALRFEPGSYCINPFALALGAIGEGAKEAVPALIAALDFARDDEDWPACADVAHALADITMDPAVRRMIQERKGRV